MKHTILNEQGILILKRDGLVMECPFKNRIPMKNELGATFFPAQECSSLCPLFHLEEHSINGGVDITKHFVPHCGDGTAIYEVFDDKPEQGRGMVILNNGPR
jgi:hypothetical protein